MFTFVGGEEERLEWVVGGEGISLGGRGCFVEFLELFFDASVGPVVLTFAEWFSVEAVPVASESQEYLFTVGLPAALPASTGDEGYVWLELPLAIGSLFIRYILFIERK